MSKKQLPQVGVPEVLRYVIESWDVQEIEGKLLTIVESIGLQQKQEEAVKGLVRQAVWDTINRPWRVILPHHLYKQAWEEQEKRRATEPKNVPI